MISGYYNLREAPDSEIFPIASRLKTEFYRLPEFT